MLSMYGCLRISFEILVIDFQMEKQTDTDCMTTHGVPQLWPCARNIDWQPTVTTWYTLRIKEWACSIPQNMSGQMQITWEGPAKPLHGRVLGVYKDNYRYYVTLVIVSFDTLFSFLSLTLEKEMVTHSSNLAWRISWTEEPGRLYSPWGRKNQIWLSD